MSTDKNSSVKFISRVKRSSAEINETSAHPSKHFYTAKMQIIDKNRRKYEWRTISEPMIINSGERSCQLGGSQACFFMTYPGIRKRFKCNV